MLSKQPTNKRDIHCYCMPDHDFYDWFLQSQMLEYNISVVVFSKTSIIILIDSGGGIFDIGVSVRSCVLFCDMI